MAKIDVTQFMDRNLNKFTPTDQEAAEKIIETLSSRRYTVKKGAELLTIIAGYLKHSSEEIEISSIV